MNVAVNQASLHKGLWGGAIDSVGGETLAWLTKTVKPWGNIVSIGMAGGAQVDTNTMPFILRGVALLGVTSSSCPQNMRKRTWQALGDELFPNNLDQICAGEVSLTDLPATFEQVLLGNHRGRYIVKL